MDEFIALVADRPDFWLSAIVILFIIGMGGFFVWFFVRHIRKEERQQKR